MQFLFMCNDDDDDDDNDNAAPADVFSLHYIKQVCGCLTHMHARTHTHTHKIH